MIGRNIKVSVLCVTYNQKDFIKQMLDSILSQKTDFNYEILINDDHSSDGTAEILKEYAKKHKNINLNLQKENLYSQGVRGMLARFLLPKAKGQYIAICEGDDYWTDPEKLQRQVDFMDGHPDYSVCFHPVTVHFENGEEKDSIYPDPRKAKEFTRRKLLKENFIQTNSVMYRRRKSYADMPQGIMPGDWYLHLYHSRFGKIGFINRCMAVYRRHSGGIWWDSYHDQDRFWEINGLYLTRFFIAVDKLYKDVEEYKEDTYSSIGFAFHQLMELSKKGRSKPLEDAMKEYPEYAQQFFMPQTSKNVDS